MNFERNESLEYAFFKSDQFAGTEIAVGYQYLPADPDQGQHYGSYEVSEVVVAGVHIGEHLSEMCLDFVRDELVAALNRQLGPVRKPVFHNIGGLRVAA